MWPYALHSTLGRCNMEPVHCALNKDYGEGDDSSIGSWDQIQMSNSIYWTHVLCICHDDMIVILCTHRLSIDGNVSIELRGCENWRSFCNKNAIYWLKLFILLFNDWTTYSIEHCTLCTSHDNDTILFRLKIMIFVIWHFHACLMSEIDF